jgi:hypothetical protein
VTSAFLARVRRGLRKPPRVVARRAAQEAVAAAERYTAPRRARALTEQRLANRHGAATVEELWERLSARPFVAAARVDAAALDRCCPGERDRVRALAERALRREVDLLGSGPTLLGTPIDWHRDFKTGLSWPVAWGRGIEYTNLDRPSDVKVPWELSRLQWLLPAAQAQLLEPDEERAAGVRAILEEWLDANPYGLGVNWAIAMESALRILSWTYLFHAFAGSEAWADRRFRFRFLAALDLHAQWTLRHVERSDVNGNHYTADAAGIAWAGSFFDEPAWAGRGWQILLEELPLQVTPDGVDFEASTAYHRLVAELFLLPALYRERVGLAVPAEYRERVSAMARAALVLTRDDGTTPLLGDADDGRALPLGGQGLGDHRYLAGIVAAAWGDDELRGSFSGPRSEAAWLLGPDAAAGLPERASAPVGSHAFADAGLYVLRGAGDHVLVDAGPVGLAGRGGHGHNDCLAVDAYLDGEAVVLDSGSYVYTADPAARNEFRSTAAHCTPVVDGLEQNPIPESLWLLDYRARPTVEEWSTGAVDLLRARHEGYAAAGVVPVRTVALDHETHRLLVRDEFRGEGDHDLLVPWPLAEGLEPELDGAATARAGRFRFRWSPDWSAEVGDGWISPSYGVRRPRRVLALRRRGPLRPLAVLIEPEGAAPAGAAWAERIARLEP